MEQMIEHKEELKQKTYDKSLELNQTFFSINQSKRNNISNLRKNIRSNIRSKPGT